MSTASKQPDQGLFLRAQQFFHAKKYEQTITILQVLCNSYPDSPYVARSKHLLDNCLHTKRSAHGFLVVWEEGRRALGVTFSASDVVEPQETTT